MLYWPDRGIPAKLPFSIISPDHISIQATGPERLLKSLRVPYIIKTIQLTSLICQVYIHLQHYLLRS